MTAYKRPVFFDRDIKSFSELSADSGLDLGIVARSILADAYLQVGTTGSAGDVQVFKADGTLGARMMASDPAIQLWDENVPTFSVDGVNADLALAKANGLAAAGLLSNNKLLYARQVDAQIEVSSAAALSLTNTNAQTTVVLNASTATATIGGPAAGTVSVKDASDAALVTLLGQTGQVISGPVNGTRTQLAPDAVTTWSAADPNYRDGFFGIGSMTLYGPEESYRVALENGGPSGGGLATLWNSASAVTAQIDGQTATATMGGAGAAGTVSVKNASDAETVALSGATGSITLSGAASKITGLVLSEITGGTDAASKAYVDSIAQGLNIKGACHVSSQGNIEVLATTTQVDGHTLSEGERVLVRYQSDAIENGIYRFNGTGLERAADMAVGSHAAGSFTFVQFGTNADQGWVCTADAPADVVGTDALPWTQFSAAGVIEAGDGLQLIGTVMSAKLDGTTLSASAAGLKVLGLPEMFEIGGLATSADVSAENLNTLTAGRASNAVGLHSHSADYTFLAAASGLAAGQAAIVSASYEAAPAGTTSSGAYVVGVVENVDAGQARIVRAGFCSAVLSGATPGDTYYVQADGSIGTALPTSGRVVFVGVAVSTLDLFVQIRDFGSILA